MPEFSVIIPHLNDPAGLDRCITALEVQTIGRDRFEIIVADNGSAIGLTALAAQFGKRALIIDAPVKGAGPARNAGVAQASGTIFAFIDADCIASPDWLREGAAALETCDFAGGRVDVLVDHSGPLTGAEAFERVFAFDFKSYAKDKGFVGSGNLFCRADTFTKVGPFGNLFSEDVEWCHRATALGFRLGYHDAAAIGHPARADWTQLLAKWRRINRETYLLYRTRPLGRLRWLLRNWLMPLSILAHIPKIIRSPALQSWQDRVRAIGTLARLRMWRLADAHRLSLR